MPKACKRVPKGHQHHQQWAKGSPKDSLVEPYGRPCCEQLSFVSKMVAQRVDLGNRFGFQNVSNSAPKNDVGKVEKMMPKWNEQMNPKRMQNQCIFWKGSLSIHILVAMVLHCFWRLRVQEIDQQIGNNLYKTHARINIVKSLYDRSWNQNGSNNYQKTINKSMQQEMWKRKVSDPVPAPPPLPAYPLGVGGGGGRGPGDPG